MLVYTSSVSSFRVLLSGDITALLLSLACHYLWLTSFTLGFSVTRDGKKNAALDLEAYFIIVLMAYLFVVMRVCSFLWTWLLEFSESIFFAWKVLCNDSKWDRICQSAL